MGIAIGIGLFTLGVILIIVRTSQANKLMQIKGAETSQIKELTDISSQVAAEMEPGSFNQIAEVKGRSVCESPLTSELAKVQCVYYSMNVTREYEETYWDTDSNGNRVQRTRRGSDSVAHNVRSTPFSIDDGTGKIRIRPDGAQLVAEKVFSQFQPGEVQGKSLSFGGLVFSLTGINIGGGSRTLGYRYEEQVIQVGRDLYALGEAVDSGGELAIQKPQDKKAKFIISVKSEEELVKSTSSAVTALLISGLVSGAGGITVLVLSLLNIINL